MALPTEILKLIAEQLCPHCSDGPILDWLPHHNVCRRALAALCLTSRKMRSIAQPLMYHRPGPIHQYSSFLRTAMERPDLAAQILEYHSLDYWELPMDNDSTERMSELFENIARVLLMDVSKDMMEKYAWVQAEDFCAEILIGLASCLQRLSFTVSPALKYNAPSTTRCEALESRFRNLLGEPGLPHLKSLYLFPGEVGHFKMTNPGVNVLLGAVPHLEELVFCQTSGLDSDRWRDYSFSFARRMPEDPKDWEPALRNLKTLVFENSDLMVPPTATLWVYLGEILEMSSKLENFKCSLMAVQEGNLEFTPISFVEALRSCATTLKSLHLDCSSATDWFIGVRLVLTRYLSPPTLAAFTALENLWLDEKSICRVREGMDWADEAGTCVTDVLDVLPRIKAFGVTMSQPLGIHVIRDLERLDDDVVWSNHIIRDLQNLADDVVRGRYPSLRKIEIVLYVDYMSVTSSQQMPELLVDLFKDTAVDVSVSSEQVRVKVWRTTYF